MFNGPFRGDEALRTGVVTRNELYGPRFRRLFPGVFVPVGLVVDFAVRTRAAYLLVEDRGGVLAGYSAALLLGADCAPRNAPAEVLVPSDARGHPGLLVRRDRLPASERTVVGGCRVTTAVRTAWDLARRLPLVEAVVATDALARAGRFAPADLLARRLAEPGARGSRRLPEVVGLSDHRAESPMETRLRLTLVRGGLPRPEAQYPVRDAHGFTLARVDLAYPPARLALEYDGAGHVDRRRWSLDRERDSTLAVEGWQTLRFGPDDITQFQTVRRVADLLTQRAPTRYGRLEIDTRLLER
jgi:very-short-patch-repair endonuclease